MANKPKRVLKKASPTVRERSEQAANSTPKQQRVRRTARKATAPLRIIGRFVAKIIRPFRFLLWPFKTRPARFVGRILAKIFFVNYFRESWQELRKVTWPGRRETLQLTFAVFVFAIVFGLMITIVDYGLNKLFEQILLK
jgi:preprotein translocase SecE subunit